MVTLHQYSLIISVSSVRSVTTGEDSSVPESIVICTVHVTITFTIIKRNKPLVHLSDIIALA